jgi:hypothetical protein
MNERHIAKLEVYPKEMIRADQAGDWGCARGGVEIVAASAEMSDRRSELAVCIHELIEAWMCREKGITDQQVTKFDYMFERERAEGKHGPFDEAGDDPRAPYRVQHEAATIVEKAVVFVLGLPWREHEANVNAIFAENEVEEKAVKCELSPQAETQNPTGSSDLVSPTGEE